MNFIANTQIFAATGVWASIKGFIANSLEWFFELTQSMGVPSYILAILFLTIVIKLITQPLMNKQMRSTRKMQLLAPEIEEIKQKYGSNMQKQQQMTMALYKEHGASPTAGCLPMLVQMPILFALFDTIRHFGESGSGHPFYPEYFNFWIWDDLSVTVADGALPFLLPILAAGATFLQQFLMSSNRKDRTQRIMLIAFPLVFLIIVRNFPILMAFYWIFYSLIGAIIMVPITRRWHKIDKAEIERKRAEKAAEEEQRKAKKEAYKGASRKGKQKKGAQNNKTNTEGDVSEEDIIDIAPEEVEGEEDLDPEKIFNNWLKENNYKIKKKKMKLHPYSPEPEIVEFAVDEKGIEYDLEELRKKHMAASQPMPTPGNLGEMFGFGKKKKN